MTTSPTPTDAMVEALKPFAELAKLLHRSESGTIFGTLSSDGEARITFEDVRRAGDAYTAALQHQEPGGANFSQQLYDHRVAATPPAPSALAQIVGELGAALVQSIPSDDQIIMGHVQKAYEIAKEARRTRNER